MSKHTPGPWCTGMLRSSPRWHDVRTSQGETIASVSTARAEVDANARLIAAAPELLSALKDARVILAGTLDERRNPAIVRGIEAAIAKATGGES